MRIEQGIVNRIDVPKLDAEKISPLSGADFAPDAVMQGVSETFAEGALFVRELSPTRHLVGLQKTRQYAREHDLMMMCVGEGEIIRSLPDLTEDETLRVFRAAARTFGLYDEQAAANGEEIVLHAVSVNFDEHVDARSDVYPRSAQSLEPLHVHVVGITREEMDRMRPLPIPQLMAEIAAVDADALDRAGKLPADPAERERTIAELRRKGEFLALQFADRYEDPLLRVVDHAIRVPAIRNELTAGLKRLHLTHEGGYAGVNFWYHDMNLDRRDLVTDLRKLIGNARGLYDTFHGYAAALGVGGGRGDHDAAFADFIARFRPSRGTTHTLRHFDRVHAFLRYLAELEHPDGPSARGRMIRDGFAYTLSLIRREGQDGYVVNMAPRFLSDGNLLAFLRIQRALDPSLSTEEQHAQLLAIRAFLRKRF